jgi:glyoxylase-like metal-dependent hydrolase (beta-lactamase superfamily II)
MKVFAVFVFAALVLSPGPDNAPALKIVPLAEDCCVQVSYNLLDGKWFPANGLHIVTENGIILLDAPWTEDYTRILIDSLENKYHKKITFCIATHFHDDRTGGLEVLKAHGVKTWSSRQTLEWCKTKGEKQADFTFEKDTVFDFGNIHLETFYPGAGHSPDNIVVWIPEKKILYGGCFVKSTEAENLGNLSDANVSEWKKGVEKVIKKFPHPAYIIPGHFGWENKKSLEYTLRLLKAAVKK